MSDSKILLTYKDDEGNYQVESVWGTKQGEYYRINNIPFFAANISFNDLVSAENDNGVLYFDELVEASGHTTIQMIIFKKEDIEDITKQLIALGCNWEGSHLEILISVDVPKHVGYRQVKRYLDEGQQENRWSYKEACLAHTID